MNTKLILLKTNLEHLRLTAAPEMLIALEFVLEQLIAEAEETEE